MVSRPETEIFCADEAATAALAGRLAARLHAGDIVALRGDLGAGKTAFARGVVRAALGDPSADVPSPTFTLVQTYDGATPPIWHFDLYRIEDPSEVLELGWDEALDEAIVLVEWPERAGKFLPATHLDVTLAFGANDTERRIHIAGQGDWQGDLDDLGA